MMEIYRFYLPFALVLLGVAQQCLSHTEEKPFELTDLLPQNVHYNKLIPPFKYKESNDHDPIVVQFSIYILALNSIDEALMTFSADVYFRQIWTDHRLNFPNITNSDHRVFDLDWLKYIWRPDTFFRNAKSIQFQEISVPNHYLRLYPNNTIRYTMKLSLELTCAMNFVFFPHDTQKCNIRFESLSHSTSDMLFKWREKHGSLEADENVDLMQLTLVDTLPDDCTYVYSGHEWPCLEVVFILKRSLGYYLINTYIPTCLIVIMSWISFWIKPETVPARVTLGVTSFLTLLTQHSKSQESLPRVAYFKMVDAFMLSSTVFVFAVLVEFCLVILTLEGFGQNKPSKAEKAAVPRNYKANIFTGQEHTLQRQSVSSIDTILCNSALSSSDNLDSISIHERLQRALLIDRISRILFPASFVVLNCVYWYIALFAGYLFTK